MASERRVGRRSVVATAGTLLLGSLAGCNGGGGDGGPYGGWLAAVEGFDGPNDATGQSSVTVTVGAGSDGRQFAPAAIEVDLGTTVRWEWTGRGGRHNVVEEDGAFDSGTAVTSGETTFEHDFTEAGTYRYYCGPHRMMGMKGVVEIVANDE